MKAREFLAQKKVDVEERDLLKQPLTEAELLALAKKLGNVRELIAPKRVKEMEKVADKDVIPFLAKNPSHVRRPLIDTGKQVTLGFTAEVREQLEEAL